MTSARSSSKSLQTQKLSQQSACLQDCIIEGETAFTGLSCCRVRSRLDQQKFIFYDLITRQRLFVYSFTFLLNKDILLSQRKKHYNLQRENQSINIS
jgi:hypothetical protein